MYQFETIGVVAAFQECIERNFNISWNELEKPPTEVPGESIYFQEPIFSEDDWMVYPERETIDMLYFTAVTSHNSYRFGCGYGQRSGRFIYRIPQQVGE